MFWDEVEIIAGKGPSEIKGEFLQWLEERRKEFWLIGATQRPWDIDLTLNRRFLKIAFDLPSKEEIAHFLVKKIGPPVFPFVKVNFEALAVTCHLRRFSLSLIIDFRTSTQ